MNRSILPGTPTYVENVGCGSYVGINNGNYVVRFNGVKEGEYEVNEYPPSQISSFPTVRNCNEKTAQGKLEHKKKPHDDTRTITDADLDYDTKKLIDDIVNDVNILKKLKTAAHNLNELASTPNHSDILKIKQLFDTYNLDAEKFKNEYIENRFKESISIDKLDENLKDMLRNALNQKYNSDDSSGGKRKTKKSKKSTKKSKKSTKKSKKSTKKTRKSRK